MAIAINRVTRKQDKKDSLCTTSDDVSPSVIAHVTETLASGILQSVSGICWATHSRFRHVVVYGSRKEMPEDFQALFPAGTKFIPWVVTRPISLSRDFKAQLDLRRILKELAPDVVHAHSSKGGAHARAANVLGTLPLCYSPRGYGFLQSDWRSWKRKGLRITEWLLGRLPQVTVPCGESEEAYARQVARKVKTIPNMIDLTHFEAIQRTDPQDRPFTVVMTGRVSAQKNFLLFREVASSLSCEGVQFIWVGGDRPSITLPSNLEITGWIGRTATLRTVANADVFLQTSLWEGLSIALLEAMALRLPIVAYPCRGNAELVKEGDNGYLADTAEAAAKRVLELRDQPKLRMRMGARSRSLVENKYASTVVGPRWLEFYSELLRSSNELSRPNDS